jgi:hypothetical protein
MHRSRSRSRSRSRNRRETTQGRSSPQRAERRPWAYNNPFTQPTVFNGEIYHNASHNPGKRDAVEFKITPINEHDLITLKKGSIYKIKDKRRYDQDFLYDVTFKGYFLRDGTEINGQIRGQVPKTVFLHFNRVNDDPIDWLSLEDFINGFKYDPTESYPFPVLFMNKIEPLSRHPRVKNLVGQYMGQTNSRETRGGKQKTRRKSLKRKIVKK